MNPTQMTLLEQMRITEIEIDSRKALLGFDQHDVDALVRCNALIGDKIDEIVTAFYLNQTSIPEIASLIGDAGTLGRLQSAQRQYVLDLFNGTYGMEYINNRLRIGLVHKRIGVEPKLYLSAVHLLRSLIITTISAHEPDRTTVDTAITALDKLVYFDVTLVFETYIQSMLSEIEAAKNRSDQYARALEETVVQRTSELRVDSLTGLMTRRYLGDALRSTLKAAQRRSEPVSVVFVDVDNFKAINDTRGHTQGDTVLREVGSILLEISRTEDICSRVGGDEFCIVLPNSTELQTQSVFCSRVNKLLAERTGGVSVSMGIIQTGPDQFESADALLKAADQRMYLSKAKSKGYLIAN